MYTKVGFGARVPIFGCQYAILYLPIAQSKMKTYNWMFYLNMSRQKHPAYVLIKRRRTFERIGWIKERKKGHLSGKKVDIWDLRSFGSSCSSSCSCRAFRIRWRSSSIWPLTNWCLMPYALPSFLAHVSHSFFHQVHDCVHFFFFLLKHSFCWSVSPQSVELYTLSLCIAKKLHPI